jgi:hypothetical protein
MALLIVLVIFWTPYLAVKLLRAQHGRTPNGDPPQQACAQPRRTQTNTGAQDWPAWSASDDRQLTLLLSDSAPRTITE